jgi:hypothetical protein
MMARAFCCVLAEYGSRGNHAEGGFFCEGAGDCAAALRRVAHHIENLVGREAFFGDDAQVLQVF